MIELRGSGGEYCTAVSRDIKRDSPLFSSCCRSASPAYELSGDTRGEVPVLLVI